MKQKGVYPYKYNDSLRKCFDDKLPDTSKFFSSLVDKCISKKHYFHAINV